MPGFESNKASPHKRLKETINPKPFATNQHELAPSRFEVDMHRQRNSRGLLESSILVELIDQLRDIQHESLRPTLPL